MMTPPILDFWREAFAESSQNRLLIERAPIRYLAFCPLLVWPTSACDNTICTVFSLNLSTDNFLIIVAEPIIRVGIRPNQMMWTIQAIVNFQRLLHDVHLQSNNKSGLSLVPHSHHRNNGRNTALAAMLSKCFSVMIIPYIFTLSFLF